MFNQTNLVAWWSELLTTTHEVPGSIPGFFVEIFPCRGRSHSDPDLSSYVEFRFKAPPGTPRSYISSLTSGQRNCALWASQTQTSVTLRQQTGRGPRSLYGHVVAMEKNFNHIIIIHQNVSVTPATVIRLSP
jgi:hypothetical protein